MSDIDWGGRPDWASHYCVAHNAWRNEVIDTIDTCCIPRPTKQEWEGGLPPVGVECEGYPDERSGFERCLVVWHDPEPEIDDHPTLALFEDGGKYCEPIWCTEFRPLKPQHDRQREELINLISHHPIYKNAVAGLADAIIKFYEDYDNA